MLQLRQMSTYLSKQCFFFSRISMIMIATDIYCITLSPLHRLFQLTIDLLSPAPNSICVPFTKNNRLASLVKANGFSREASQSKHCKSLKEGRATGGFVNLESQVLLHISALMSVSVRVCMFACVCWRDKESDTKSERR